MRDRRQRPPQPFDIVIDGLACYRVTRLVVEDHLFDRPRDRLVARLQLGDHLKLIELIGCPWCVSVYVGFGIVAARRLAPNLWGPVASALAASAAAGLLAGHEGG